MDNFDLIDNVNGLIETCKDGEIGFRTCSIHAKTSDLKLLFNTCADDCRAAAAELQGLVGEHLSGVPENKGSTGGALHRGWVAVKGKLTGYSDLALLEECERGEDVAMDHYRRVLDEELPTVVRAVVERHYVGLKRNHAQIRGLRDAQRLTHA